MEVELVKEFSFEAAHRLPHAPEGHKCRRLHGHSFRVSVCVRGPVDPDTGWFMDYADIAAAVKPLLDALVDERHSQQRIAIEVLAYVQNRGAGPALFNFATGQAERELRVRAMVACGALGDPALLSRYQNLLAPGGPDGQTHAAAGDAITVAAACSWPATALAKSRCSIPRQPTA